MSDALASVLKDYSATWQPNPEGFLFVNRNGRPYAANKVVEYGLLPVLDKLQIPRAGMHAFRHCHASLLMDAGANPAVTKEQMRHLGSTGMSSATRSVMRWTKLAKFCARMRPNRRRQVSIFDNLHGAGDGNRTHIRSLGSYAEHRKTFELAAF
jgi:integrase